MVFGTYSPYDYDVAILKKYGSKYKLTLLNVVRKKGYECENAKSKKGSVNSEKEACNLARTRSTIFELSSCNEWDLFCTFTLDPNKYDRFKLDKFRDDFTHMIRDLRRKYNCEIRYLLIPEKHKNGAWHMHGFIAGLPADELRKFEISENLPRYIKNKLKEGQIVFEWKSYRRRFGFCDLEVIRDKDKASSYVTKYITKDLLDSVSELNHKSYYCSQGLKRAEEIKRGHLAKCPGDFDYVGDYAKIKWFENDSEEILKDLIAEVK